MKIKTFIFLTLALSALQGNLLPTVFLEGVVLLWFFLTNELKRALPAAFFSGIIFDLFQAQTLGLSSLTFVVAGFAVGSLSGNLPLRHPLLLFVLVALFNFVRSQVLGVSPSLFALLLPAALAMALFGSTKAELPGKIKI